MLAIVMKGKRKRSEKSDKSDKLEKSECSVPFNVGDLNVLKSKFYQDKTNLLIQNSLCSNSLYNISEVREYMQSRDCEFSNTIDPELIVSNQGLSGRCWLFAVLNVMRHEMVRKYKLQHNFELSESYVCFYEKLEKCNFFLTRFLNVDRMDANDFKIRNWLLIGCEDGGYWITCANLIKKYGIIPKSCYRESINSYHTDQMNSTLNCKLREFALQLVDEKDMDRRLEMKNEMMETIYEILCKFLGVPPNPNEKFQWSFSLYLDLSTKLEREAKRQKNGEYENLQIKKTSDITPLEFYDIFVVNKLDDYIKFGHDPRNEYNRYYISPEDDVVVGGERTGYFNVQMEEISNMCIKSILDNTPVEFDCDVIKYLNSHEELMDTKCYDFGLVFNTSFTNMNKKQQMECLESYPNHAMVLVGVDLDSNDRPIKWKVENSWGRDDDKTGYYTMSHEWFEKFVYTVAIQKKYIPRALKAKYNKQVRSPVTLPDNDIMAN
jgi:bleomycin hydrolase